MVSTTPAAPAPPAPPATPRLFYGWVIVACTWLANFTTVSNNPLVFAFFLDIMAKDLGVSRGTLVFGITIRMVAGGFFAPVLGHIVDRYGARWPGVIAGIIAGGSMAGFAVTSNIWVLYALFLVSGLTGFSIVGGNVLTIVPPANWFVQKRGRAMAISSAGQLLGSSAFAIAAALLISSVGWRATWGIFGAIAFLGVVPTYGLLMRRRPEDMGLHPDGAVPAAEPPRGAAAHRVHAEARSAAHGADRDFTLREALRTPVWWANLAAFTVIASAISPFLLFRNHYWTTLGFSPALIAVGVALDPFCFAVANMIMGFFAERIPIRFAGVLGGVLRTLGLLPLTLGMTSPSSVILHNVVWGTGSGTTGVFQTMVIPDYFGRAHQGSIRGVTTLVMVVISAFGGPVGGYLLDAGMSYTVFWWAIMAGVALASASFFFQKPPRPMRAHLPPAVEAAGPVPPR